MWPVSLLVTYSTVFLTLHQEMPHCICAWSEISLQTLVTVGYSGSGFASVLNIVVTPFVNNYVPLVTHFYGSVGKNVNFGGHWFGICDETKFLNAVLDEHQLHCYIVWQQSYIIPSYHWNYPWRI